jgi:hypothetical protein
VRELLRLEADTRMKLKFKPLTGVWLDPVAVNALVLFIQPRISQSYHFEAQFPHIFDVVSDTLRVVGLLVLKRVPDRVRQM